MGIICALCPVVLMANHVRCSMRCWSTLQSGLHSVNIYWPLPKQNELNRAAMGRARFLLYTGFIINRAAMGRARFLLCTGFFFFFVFLSVTRPKPPLGQITIGTESRNLGCLFAKSCWNNDVRKMLRIMFSLLWIIYIFLWVFSKRWIQREYWIH